MHFVKVLANNCHDTTSEELSPFFNLKKLLMEFRQQEVNYNVLRLSNSSGDISEGSTKSDKVDGRNFLFQRVLEITNMKLSNAKLMQLTSDNKFFKIPELLDSLVCCYGDLVTNYRTWNLWESGPNI